MAVLVTGGAGFIGSHTSVELLNAGYETIIVDNFSNSNPEVIPKIEKITQKQIKLYEADLLNSDALDHIFKKETIDTVIHFAGFKAVGESVAIPLNYYYNNITGTLILCESMQRHGVKELIFSSSATVYNPSNKPPWTEDMTLEAASPYGWTKLMIEQILKDLHLSDPTWSISLLRYFNPVGAHESGLIGEDPNGIPNNLMPYITQVAAGKLERLRVFGSDYETHDGTGVRDYIHVVDLAKGHVAALKRGRGSHRTEAYNLGTGQGYSVLDVVRAFEEATGIVIPYDMTERRPGDIAKYWADPKKANQELEWRAEKTLVDMCRDAWNFQKRQSE
jgi:UDP-glucose 4-epimerase